MDCFSSHDWRIGNKIPSESCNTSDWLTKNNDDLVFETARVAVPQSRKLESTRKLAFKVVNSKILVTSVRGYYSCRWRHSIASCFLSLFNLHVERKSYFFPQKSSKKALLMGPVSALLKFPICQCHDKRKNSKKGAQKNKIKTKFWANRISSVPTTGSEGSPVFRCNFRTQSLLFLPFRKTENNVQIFVWPFCPTTVLCIVSVWSVFKKQINISSLLFSHRTPFVHTMCDVFRCMRERPNLKSTEAKCICMKA